MVGLGNGLKDRNFKPKVLTEQVSQVLKEAILNGELQPGAQLVETELQKQLGVSRSPLREAFRDLEKMGLVSIIPRRGTFVRAITRKDIEENFPVRAALEGLAAREAHPQMGPNDLARMADALKGMRRAGQDKDHEAYRKNHLAFHDIFIQASDNQLLIDLLSNLRMHRLWYFVSFRYHQEIETTMEVHSRIFGLFKDKNADSKEVEAVVRNHIEEALARLFGDMDDEDLQL
jgi:DNA-binding GntR family transcriptional regulator